MFSGLRFLSRSGRARPKCRLGVDLGGVIIQGRAGVSQGEDTAFRSLILETPEVEGAFATLFMLGPKFDGVWVISKARPKTRKNSRIWLRAKSFYSRAGVRPRRVVFCATREGKARAADRHGITHFVDDKVEVLEYMHGTVPNLYLFASDPEEVAKAWRLPYLTIVNGWPELWRLLGK